MRTKLFKQTGIFCLALATALSAFGMKKQNNTSCSQDSFLNAISEKKEPNQKTRKYFIKTKKILEENDKPLEAAIIDETETEPLLILIGKFWLNPKLEGQTFKNITRLKILPENCDTLKKYTDVFEAYTNECNDLFEKDQYKCIPKDDGIFNSEDVKSISKLFPNLKILNIFYWNAPVTIPAWCASIKNYLIEQGLKEIYINAQQLDTADQKYVFNALNKRSDGIKVGFLSSSLSKSKLNDLGPLGRNKQINSHCYNKEKAEKIGRKKLEKKGITTEVFKYDSKRSENIPSLKAKTEYEDYCWAAMEQCGSDKVLALSGKFWLLPKFSSVQFKNITRVASLPHCQAFDDSLLDSRYIPEDDCQFTSSDANKIRQLFPNLRSENLKLLGKWKFTETEQMLWMIPWMNQESEGSSNQTLQALTTNHSIQDSENPSVKFLSKAEKKKLQKAAKKEHKKIVNKMIAIEETSQKENNEKEIEIKKQPNNKENETKNEEQKK